jgi:hypothetical protein
MSWPPSSYDETYKLVASVAIFGAAVWGVLTWCRQERLRKQKEEPGFECSMECSQSTLPDGDVLLSIDVVTMNTGVLPLRPATKQASISIKAVNSQTSETFIEEEVDARRDVVFPAADRDDMRLEPGTRTVFSGFYKAKANHLYAVEFDLPARKDGQGWHWKKRRVVYVSDKLANAEST